MSARNWRKGVYQSTTYIAIVLLLLIIFVSAAYFFAIPEQQILPNQAKILDELRASREAWDRTRPLSFRYIVDRTCNCPEEYMEPYVATEQRGYRTAEYRSHVQTRSGEVLATPPQPVWIHDLFGLVENAIAVHDAVRVAYNPRYWYPTLIDIERDQDGEDANDRYEIRDFEVLEYD